MGAFDHIPKAGVGFSASFGAGSFKAKLTQGMSHSSTLAVLHHHPKAVEALTRAVQGRQRYIRSGGLSEYQIRDIRTEVQKADPTLSSVGKRAIVGALQHLSRAAATKQAAEAPKPVVRPPTPVYEREREPSPSRGAPIATQQQFAARAETDHHTATLSPPRILPLSPRP